ncbi:MAG: bifunctional methylenetetrahydrofolate dehydrogenase/methenyltetrahydrofolate cyclohydrolase FolD [bacterium]
MSAIIIDGKKISEKILDSVATSVADHVNNGGVRPGLAVVLVGEDPASKVYVNNKHKACERAGFVSRSIQLPQNVSQQELVKVVEDLNNDTEIHGILVQFPLPEQLDSLAITEVINPHKDVDGFHPFNIGRLVLRNPVLNPCTPRGIMRLLFESDLDVRGKHAVVVGASNIVGLLMAGATVTSCHRFTEDLQAMVGMGDVVIVAVGKAAFIPGQWLKKGAIVIDVGINRMDDGRLQGDVEFETAVQRAGWITPVPGGVGPMTVATLMVNTLEAAGYKIWETDHRGRFVK